MPIREYSALSQIPDSLDAAFEAAETRSVFLGRPWLELFERTVAGADRRLCILALEPGPDDAAPAAVLPLWRPHDGAELHALGNFYTSLAGVVVDAAHPGAAAAAARLAAAAGSMRPAAPRMVLSPLEHEDSTFDALRSGLAAAGWWTQPYFCFGNWYLECPGADYERYFAALPSRTRNTVKRRGKQFQKLPGARLELVTGGERLEPGIAAYDDVYARSWKQPEPYPEFVPGLIREAARHGWLRLGIAWLGETPVAAQIWLVVRGRANIYKLAYDEEHKKLSAGSLLTDLLMRHVMDVDGVHEVDYLTGDDAYKQEWMSTRRERWGIAAFNPRTVAGLAAGVRHLGAARLKSLRDRAAGR